MFIEHQLNLRDEVYYLKELGRILSLLTIEMNVCRIGMSDKFKL